MPDYVRVRQDEYSEICRVTLDLRHQCERIVAHRDSLIAGLARVTAERDAARELLRTMEWCEPFFDDADWGQRCWSCEVAEPGPHLPDCAWKRAMGEA